MHSSDIVSECGYFMFCRLVWAETDGCICGQFQSQLVFELGVGLRSLSVHCFCVLD